MQNSKYEILNPKQIPKSKIQNPKRMLWVMLGVFLCLLTIFIFIKWQDRGTVSIKTAVLKRGLIEAVVSASGTVDAPVYELGPKMSGKIIAINIKEGDQVKEGETLVEFDDTSRLVAPKEGIVAKINYEEGETTAMGQPVLTIVNYNHSWVEAQIDEIDIAGVKIGDKVKITSDVYPDKIFEGEIYWIAPLAELRKVGGRVKMDEESYVFPCKIKFLNGSSELKVNMSVNVDIVTQRNENALLVPREALVSKDDSSTVFVVKKGPFISQVFQNKINIGIRSSSYVEATAGIQAGDIIAVTNVSKLKDKGRVKIER